MNLKLKNNYFIKIWNCLKFSCIPAFKRNTLRLRHNDYPKDTLSLVFGFSDPDICINGLFTSKLKNKLVYHKTTYAPDYYVLHGTMYLKSVEKIHSEICINNKYYQNHHRIKLEVREDNASSSN